jgi:hypothetical protein
MNKKLHIGREKNNRPPKGNKELNSLPPPPWIAYELLNQNSSHFNCQMSQQKINCCPKTIFIFPVTENELLQ